jgi:hypothetical protein
VLKIILLQPKAEGRPPVVVSTPTVIKTETLRALPHQADGNPRHDFQKTGGQHGSAKKGVVMLGKGQTIHG